MTTRSGMNQEFDYYAVLGVRPTATPLEIQEQYRRLAKLYHPDANPGHDADYAKRMRMVNEAYGVLSDPRERAAYDIRHTIQQNTESMAYGSPQWEPAKSHATVVERPRLRRREAAGAIAAVVLVVGGIAIAGYKLIASSSPITASMAPPVVARYIPPPPTPQHAVSHGPRVGEVSVKRHAPSHRRPHVSSHVREANYRHRPMSSAEKDAVAGALAAKYAAARRADDNQ